MLLIEIAIRFAPNLKITRVEIGKNPEWKQTGKLDQVSFGIISDFGKKNKKKSKYLFKTQHQADWEETRKKESKVQVWKL